MACAEIALLLSLASYHLDDANSYGYEYNEFNPGLTARCQVSKPLALEAGAYYNSIDNETVYAGIKLSHGNGHVITGLATGYYSDVVPYFGVGYDIGRLELLLLPGASFEDLATPTVLTFRWRIK